MLKTQKFTVRFMQGSAGSEGLGLYSELSAFAADKSFSEWFLTPFPTELCTEFMI